jgi:hypothetical protein
MNFQFPQLKNPLGFLERTPVPQVPAGTEAKPTKLVTNANGDVLTPRFADNPCPFQRAIMAMGAMPYGKVPLGLLYTIVKTAARQDADGFIGKMKAALAAETLATGSVALAILANGPQHVGVNLSTWSYRSDMLAGGPFDKPTMDTRVIQRLGPGTFSATDLARFDQFAKDYTPVGSDTKERGMSSADFDKMFQANREDPARKGDDTQLKMAKGERDAEFGVLARRSKEGPDYISLTALEHFYRDLELPADTRARLQKVIDQNKAA